ncbi:MAG: hypothetical protein A4E25_01752 [Methanobacterium sp. PtaB.Bin024]|jgi:hypothetical protein|nr:MAG: hypothetical protein A4E25_01752 [Methanobacterium sp. PtaB.Bin024]
MVFCAKCGSENVDEAVYCSECGQKLLQVDDLMESPGTSYSEKEILQEMIHVAWKSGMNRKVLYFTNENIYVGEGTLLSGGMGFAAGGLIGRHIEKKRLAEMEEEANRINFKELAAHNPDVVVIPYNEIINLVMGKKRMLLAPSIKVETTSTEYTFTVMDFKKYKQFQQSIPAILGDKVTVE